MLQVREKSYSRLLKNTRSWYLSRDFDGIPSYARPLNTVPVEEGFIPSVVVLLPVFPFAVFSGADTDSSVVSSVHSSAPAHFACRSSFRAGQAHQIDDLLDQTS